jgi:hypothetical protein
MSIKLPSAFGTLLSALNAAGVKTGTARGFWGGVTPDDDIVVTAWIDPRLRMGGGRFQISRPHTRHGGLRDMWDLGRIEPGATVKLILLRQRGDPDRQGSEKRQVKDAALMPERWRVVEGPFRDENGRLRAIVEPVSTPDPQAAPPEAAGE